MKAGLGTGIERERPQSRCMSGTLGEELSCWTTTG